MRLTLGILILAVLVTGALSAVRVGTGDWHETAIAVAIWVSVLGVGAGITALLATALWCFGWI